jgi:hypothetical protein
MANCNPPVRAQAFDLSASLFTTAGALITNVGTLTLKISKDFGDWGDAHGAGASDEDTTYGQVKIALDATDMTADVVDVYLKDDTAGCVPFKCTIYTCSATRGLAGTALPNAAADAAGGLPISDAGGLDLDAQIKTDIDAILADTNELQTDWANGGRLDLILDTAAASAGSGAITWTYTVTSSVDATPIEGVDIWATTDSAGTNIVASGVSSVLGVVTFYLDAGTYYIWRQKAGWDFTNPDTEVVS